MMFQRERDRLLHPVPGDRYHDPGVQEDRDHLAHRLPGTVRLLLLDAGGAGRRPGGGRLYLPLRVDESVR